MNYNSKQKRLKRFNELGRLYFDPIDEETRKQKENEIKEIENDEKRQRAIRKNEKDNQARIISMVNS